MGPVPGTGFAEGHTIQMFAGNPFAEPAAVLPPIAIQVCIIMMIAAGTPVDRLIRAAQEFNRR